MTINHPDRMSAPVRRHLPLVALLALLLVSALLLPSTVSANGGPNYVIEEGETHEGDLYHFSATVEIHGTQTGDLTAFCQRLEVTGTVDGDVNVWAQSIKLGGTVTESARVFCQSVEVTGTVEGDLVAFCADVEIAPGAHIIGDLTAGGARVAIHGTVEGSLEATGGEVILSGVIGEDAEIEADVVEIEPGASIVGDLNYKSRTELDPEETDAIGGEISYLTKAREEHYSSDDGGSGFMMSLGCMLVMLLIGLATLAVVPSPTTGTIVSTLKSDGLRSAGVGFITFIVVPVASLLVCILLITIPLVAIELMLFGLLVYLAKLPVAIMVGRLILERFGRGGASSYLELTIGIPVLYLVFAIPVIGWLAWWAVMFTGLGAIVLVIWEARQARISAGPVPPAPPVPTGAQPGAATAS